MNYVSSRLIALVLLFVAIESCKHQTPIVQPIPSPAATATASQSVEPISIEPKRGHVDFVPDPYYANAAEIDLIRRASAKMDEVVHSKCFHDFMASRKMIQTNGNLPDFIADQFYSTSGSIPVKFYYYRFTSARAYRQPPELTINLNEKFITPDSDICDVAGTLAHESIGHSLLNYEHDFNWSASREFSVPYSSDHAFASEPYSLSDSGGCCK